MSRPINLWWLLPVVTLTLGISAAYITQLTVPVLEQNKPEVRTTAPSQLTVATVALPPAPSIYQPQLTAKLVDNKVVVEQAKATTPVTQQAKPPSKEVAIDSALAQRFNQVLAEMEQDKEKPALLHPQPLTRYPQWYQDLVPPLEFSEHIYSSKPNESRVRVNNQVVKEGELIDSRMRIVKIEPQQVIIQLQQRQFSLPALSSW